MATVLKATVREYILHIPFKGYWDVSPNNGVGWTHDVMKATRFREDVIDKLPWKINDRSHRWVLVETRYWDDPHLGEHQTVTTE